MYYTLFSIGQLLMYVSPTTDSPKKRKTTGKNRAYVLVPTYLVSSDPRGCRSTTPPTPSPTKNRKYVAGLSNIILSYLCHLFASP
jgi:hypothetical protein